MILLCSSPERKCTQPSDNGWEPVVGMEAT